MQDNFYSFMGDFEIFSVEFLRYFRQVFVLSVRPTYYNEFRFVGTYFTHPA